MGEVSDADPRLLAVRRRHASGGRDHGRVGPARRARDRRDAMSAGPAARYDAIVIGGGTNGLVAAAALARAGRRVLVVERDEQLGGQSRLIELAPGFRAPISADGGWLPASVARGVGLTAMPSVDPDVAIAVAAGDGRFLTLARDPRRAAEAIRDFSSRDAERWPSFVSRLGKLAGFLEALYQLPAPDVDARLLG